MKIRRTKLSDGKLQTACNLSPSPCLSLLVFVVGANTAEENTKINEFLNLRKELRAFKNVQLNLFLSLSQFYDYESF